jgi:hypothetical protein
MIITFDDRPAGTKVFDQYQGARFSPTGRIVVPALGTASGTQALSNSDPGVEFPSSLSIDFPASQTHVRLYTGLDDRTRAPVQAELTAFDGSGTQVARDGPVTIGPGPAAVRIVLEVQTAIASIDRVEVTHDGGGGFILIDSLEFDVVGPAEPPDTEPPTVTFTEPTESARLTGETFILRARVHENHALAAVRFTIANASGQQGSEVPFYGAAPDYEVGPFWTGSLVDGPNTLTLVATDFAGNIGSASIGVHRVPIAGRLHFEAEPVEVPRPPKQYMLRVDLEETFPGSLIGRGDIDIRVTAPPGVGGYARIRDYFNQPVPRALLPLQAGGNVPLGKNTVTIQAVEVATRAVLDTQQLTVSITPGREVGCAADNIMLYYGIDRDDLTKRINAGLDEQLRMRTDIAKFEDMEVRYGSGVLLVRQSYLAGKYGFTATIQFSASLRVSVDLSGEPRVVFTYAQYSVNADPDLPDWLWLVKDILYPIFQGKFEDAFNQIFHDLFLQRLTNEFNQRIDDQQAIARFFLRDAYITPWEFGLGFCIPIALF